MSIHDQITKYISEQSETKRNDMKSLHGIIQQILQAGKLWFFDGYDEKGKMVSNPNIGYGSYTIKYADGKTREFYQIGMSANTTGISVYVMGVSDKKYLSETYGKIIGKAKVTGYCINFKALKDIDVEILQAAIKYGVNATS